MIRPTLVKIFWPRPITRQILYWWPRFNYRPGLPTKKTTEAFLKWTKKYFAKIFSLKIEANLTSLSWILWWLCIIEVSLPSEKNLKLSAGKSLPVIGTFIRGFCAKLLWWIWIISRIESTYFLLVMGPGQKFLTRVGSGQPFMVWVCIWKISPKKVKFFNFFPSGQKKSLWVGSESTRVKGGLASYILRIKSKLGSGWVGSGPIFTSYAHFLISRNLKGPSGSK